MNVSGLSKYSKILLIIYCSMAARKAKAQQTIFDSSGRISFLKTNATNEIGTPDLQLLQEHSARMKQDARELLLEKAEEARRIITSNYYKPSLHKLYLRIWKNDSLELVQYMDHVIASLGDTTTANFNGSQGEPFKKAFNGNLSGIAKIFTWETLGAHTGTVWKKDPFTGFLTDYYNASLDHFTNAQIKLKKEDLVEATRYLVEQKMIIDSLLRLYRDNNLDSFRHSFYDSIRIYHNELTSNTSVFSKLLSMFSNSWFKDWFWVRGGEIRLNPLDLSARDSLIKKPSLDILDPHQKLQLRYLDFFVENRLDTLDGFFKSNLQSLLTVDKAINKVLVPEEGDFASFSGSGTIRFQNNKTLLSAPEDVKGKKVVVVHNIPAKRKVVMREDRKAFVDRSAFQEEFDDVVSNLAVVAQFYAKLTPYGSVLDFFLPKPNYTNANIIPPKDPNTNKSFGTKKLDYSFLFDLFEEENMSFTIEGITLSGSSNLIFADVLRQSLIDINLYDPLLYPMFRHDTINLAQAILKITQLDSKLRHYLSLLMQKKIAEIKQDSFYIHSLLTIYNESSTPRSKPVKATKDPSLLFYSEVKETTPVDSTVENRVRLYTLGKEENAKDSLLIDHFTYKVGKHKKFTVSAGIAYTTNSYDQSIASDEDGAIKITNNTKQYRMVVGMNYYPGSGLFNQHDSFWGKTSERLYIFAGVGIPSPLENIYLGLGRDLFPGLKLTVGAHIAKSTEYFIENNVIVEENVGYQLAGPFVSLKIDPTSLISVLNIFQKQ